MLVDDVSVDIIYSNYGMLKSDAMQFIRSRKAIALSILLHV